MAKNTGSTKKESLLSKAIRIILQKNLAVKKSESLLLVYDKPTKMLAKKFQRVAVSYVNTVEVIEVPVLERNGQEPPKEATEKMTMFDTIVILMSKSLTHTKARRDATAAGARVASMPGVNEEIMQRSIDVDYERMEKEGTELRKMFSGTKSVRILSSAGTDLSFSINGRNAAGIDLGIYTKKGMFGNLPAGEIYVAPLEGTAYGRLVVDGSIAGFGKVSKLVNITIKDGYAVALNGSKEAELLAKLLDSVGKKARNIAEFGIGLNRKAKITGIVLEDEKVCGTCHIALGNNIGFGGTVDVPLHIDCVVRKPTIYFDERKIMNSGRLKTNLFK